MRTNPVTMLSAACLLFLSVAWAADRGDSAAASTPYRPEWASLKTHHDPVWFRDAKFGIYTHWGPVTVGSEDCPCGGQWYGQEMYSPKSGVFAWHKQHFGDQTKSRLQGLDFQVQGRTVRRRGLGRLVRPIRGEVRGPCGRPPRQFRHVGFRRYAMEFGEDGATSRRDRRAGKGHQEPWSEIHYDFSPRFCLALL